MPDLATRGSSNPDRTDAAPELDSAIAYAISRQVAGVSEDQYANGGTVVPDDLPGVINVSGTVLAGMHPPQKRVPLGTGPSVLITAPSNDLYTTGPGNIEWTAWGSLSTMAWTAGTIALIKAVYPHISPAAVERALAESASYHPAGGYNTTIAPIGLINPIGALRAAGRLQGLRWTAKPGPAVVSADARLASGPRPGKITAIHHAPAMLAAFGAAILLGLALLLIAFMLLRRWRHQARMQMP